MSRAGAPEVCWGACRTDRPPAGGRADSRTASLAWARSCTGP